MLQILFRAFSGSYLQSKSRYTASNTRNNDCIAFLYFPFGDDCAIGSQAC